MKAIFMPVIVANREHLERSWTKRRVTYLAWSAERREILPGFSLMPTHVEEETTRGKVELGLSEAHNTTRKAFFGSGPHRRAL
jgi:hypothetical protein